MNDTEAERQYIDFIRALLKGLNPGEQREVVQQICDAGESTEEETKEGFEKELTEVLQRQPKKFHLVVGFLELVDRIVSQGGGERLREIRKKACVVLSGDLDKEQRR
jgi:hypothetical protein